MSPPKPLRGPQLGTAGSPHPATCVGAQGFVCANGGRGTEGQSPPATFLQPWKSRMCHPPPLFLPLSTAGQRDRGKEEPKQWDCTPAIPGKRGQPCGEEGSAGAFPGSPRAQQPLPQRLGRGWQRPGPPRRPQRKRLSSPRAPEAA